MTLPGLILLWVWAPLSFAAANRVTFTVPRWSASAADCRRPDSTLGPAGVKKIRVWFASFRPGATYYNWWALGWGVSLRAAGSRDGVSMSFPINPNVCAPGDSCGARAAVADSAGNWTCQDAVVRFRR